MLSIKNVSVRQASSYYEKDDYYVRKDTENYWSGKLKDEFNLPDLVNKKDFDYYLKDHFQPGKDHHDRVGFDLCFSAPKSVSIAMILDDKLNEDIMSAHHEAVQEILNKIEEREIGTRITVNKQTMFVNTVNMLCAKFDHFVSRAQDPQLHTHCLIMNMTMYNGKLYSIDNKNLYQNKMIYGQMYRNLLALKLMEKGYDITVTNQEEGFFELTGVPDHIIQEMSKRRKEIEDKIKDLDHVDAKSLEKVTLLTRQAKEEKDINVLKDSWRETIREMGGIKITAGAPILPAEQTKDELFEMAIDRMSRKSFAFTEREFKRLALAYGVGVGLSEDEFYNRFQQVIERSIIPVGTPKLKKGFKNYRESFYITRKSYELEQKIIDRVLSSKGTMEALTLYRAEQVLKSLATGEDGKLIVSDQQKNAILFLTTCKDQFCAVQGLAGTGKTFMLNYARQIWEAEGYTVRGACFTGKAAEGLQADANIESSTLHRFLNQLEKEAGNLDLSQDFRNKTGWDFDGLTPGKGKEVWIVDEASMVDNVAMDALIEAARIKNAKVCFVGDDRQLLSVGVGNAFADLVTTNKIAYVTLDDIRRQKVKDLLESVKKAVLGERDGLGKDVGVEKSFDILEQSNSVRFFKREKDQIEAIVKDYISLPDFARKDTEVLVTGSDNCEAINSMIRSELRKHGLAKGREYKLMTEDGLEFRRNLARNEKIVFLKDDEKFGIKKGETGYIEKIDKNVFYVRSGDDVKIIDLKEYAYMDWGYAKEIHGQDPTDKRTLIYAHSDAMQVSLDNKVIFDVSKIPNDVKVYMNDPVVKSHIDGLRELMKKDTIQVIPDRKERLKAVVDEYTSLSPEERSETVVLTAQNRDRRELNRKIRAILKQNGELEKGHSYDVMDGDGVYSKREFSVKDRIIFLMNDTKIGIMNGQVGYIEKIEGNKFTVKCGDKFVEFDISEYKYVDHGYSMTTHKAQGITVNRALIHMDSAQEVLNSRNSYYVDISRARIEVKMFVDDLHEIKNQSKLFARKLSSEDFLIPKELENPQNNNISGADMRDFPDSSFRFLQNFSFKSTKEKFDEILRKFQKTPEISSKSPEVSPKGPEHSM